MVPTLRYGTGIGRVLGVDVLTHSRLHLVWALMRPSQVRFHRLFAPNAAHLTRVAHEMCLTLRWRDSYTRDSIRAPVTSIEAAIDAVLEGIDGRAGLILCVLYGEPPSILSRLVDAARTRSDVVGIDLAGGPIPQHRFGMDAYGPAFSRARDIGLGRTVHAGEAPFS